MKRAQLKNAGHSGRRKVHELDVLDFLFSRRDGATVVEVADALGVSRPTAQPHLNRIGNALGVQQVKDGQAFRYRAPRTPLTGEQHWALAVVREWLVALNGTRVVQALDAILGEQSEKDVGIVVDAPDAIEDPAVCVALHEGHLRRRVRVDYWSMSDTAPRSRTIEVHELRQEGGAWYVTASDVDALGKVKTFKVSRCQRAEVTAVPNSHRPDLARFYEHSVGIWEGPLLDVRVRLFGAAARQAPEFRLNITQREEVSGAGVVDVIARVAGVEETARWVWRWGGEAQALSPPELVERVSAGLQTAAARY